MFVIFIYLIKRKSFLFDLFVRVLSALLYVYERTLMNELSMLAWLRKKKKRDDENEEKKIECEIVNFRTLSVSKAVSHLARVSPFVYDKRSWFMHFPILQSADFTSNLTALNCCDFDVIRNEKYTIRMFLYFFKFINGIPPPPKIEMIKFWRRKKTYTRQSGFRVLCGKERRKLSARQINTRWTACKEMIVFFNQIYQKSVRTSTGWCLSSLWSLWLRPKIYTKISCCDRRSWNDTFLLDHHRYVHKKRKTKTKLIFVRLATAEAEAAATETMSVLIGRRTETGFYLTFAVHRQSAINIFWIFFVYRFHWVSDVVYYRRRSGRNMDLDETAHFQLNTEFYK